MVKIQLETGYLDVKEGADFPLNFGVAEIRDLTKRSGTFSKSITLVGSKNNHDLLNHYYDVNIEAGTFNINTLTKCTVLQNDIPILSDASLQLTAVNKRQWSVDDENKIEYTVLIKDAQADFFTKIDNGELTDLDFSDLNHTYSSANVVASWSNTSGYVYPLGLTPNNTIPLSEFRPAIYLKEYWDRIHAVAGFQYEWAELSDGLFDKLVIPFNGEALTFDYSDFQVDANVTTALTFTQSVGSNSTSTSGDITTWTETQDNQNLFNPTTGVYSVPFYIAPGQAVTYRVTIDFDFNLINGTGADAYLVDMLSSPATARYRYQPQYLLRDASNIIAQSGLGTLGQFTFNEGVALANGTTTLGSTSITFEIAASNLLPTDIITNRARVFVDSVSTVRWKDANSTGAADVQIDYELDITSLAIEIVPSSNILQFGATVEMDDFLPKKVKQKDLIKSVCTMYNLLVEPDEENPNKLIYKSKDAYYDAGAEKDWTQKLAKNIDHQILFLPELSAKKLQLSYKPDKDEPNVVYEDATKEVYGQLEFTYDNEYVRGVDRKELIFSPTPATNNTFNAVVPMIGGGAPQTNIRLLIHNGTQTCNPFNIYDFGTTGQTNLTSYPVCLHFDNTYNPTFDINFAVCDYYFYPNITLTNNNLYNLYWRRTVNQINKGKMLVGLFDLNENDIHNLRLNDKIYVRDSWWHINKIVDYNPTKDLLTKVELISVDDEIELAPFRTKPLLTESVIRRPIREIVDRFYDRVNVNLSKGSVIVKGVGNVIQEGVKGFVEGDYKSVSESGIIVDGVGDNFANTDLTFTGNRSHDTNGYDLQITTDGGAYGEGWLYIDDVSNQSGFNTSYIWWESTGATMYGLGNEIAKITGTDFKFERSVMRSIISTAAAYLVDDVYQIINCTANTFTVTLPTAIGIGGREYTIKNSGSGVITVDGDGAETIDGSATRTLNQYDSLTIVSDGTNWIVI
jgi:hypothetical protein